MKKLFAAILALGTLLNVSAIQTNNMLQELKIMDTHQGLIPGTRLKDSFSPQEWLTRGVDGNTFSFGYSAGIGNALGYPTGYVLEAAIEIPSYMSKNWLGNKITNVNLGFGQSPNKKLLLYITKDLTGEPEYMQEVTATTEMAWNSFKLDTPYEIDGSAFYIGYQAVMEGSGNFPFGIDLIYTENEMGDIFIVNNEVFHIGSLYGSNCIRFDMEGEVKPEYDALTDVLFTSEIVDQKEQFEAEFTLLNLGSETIYGLDLECYVGGVEVSGLEVEVYGNVTGAGNGIQFGDLGLVIVKGYPGDVSGNALPVDVTINALKGADGQGAFKANLYGEMTVTTKSYPKNIVVEEFTGTWCGWCPRGIVGMEYMKKNYADQGFIGIAAHNDDPMALPNYQGVISAYGQGFPSATLNRYFYPVSPAAETLESYFLTLKDTPATAGVDLTALYDETKGVINATASVEFGSLDPQAGYAFAFVVTEDHVGPYAQTNYYANNGAIEPLMDEWNKMASKAEWYFDEVARLIVAPYGIEDSLPASLELGQSYDYSVELPAGNVKDINNSHVVAMVLNTTTGEILNAAQVSLKGQAGVESLVAEPEDGVYKVYNLQGVKVVETQDASVVSSLPRGIYIINGKKVII